MNKKQFISFYQKNIDKLFRFFYLRVNNEKYAEDLVSLAFLKLWERTQQVNNSPIRNPVAFLYQTARHLLVDFYRRKANDPLSLDQLMEESGLQIPHSGFARSIENKLEIVRVKNSLQRIKPLYADVIIWHYLNDLSVNQIAKILNKREGTVRVLLHRALKVLRKELEKQDKKDK
ncbi:sigma-70 family RNA polymerase sigma factor [bacterium]|nr:sigma-70 family RNA polymerase sigma factor [bacterium]